LNVGHQVHEAISRRLLVPIARAQRLARPSRRPAMQAFYQGLRFRRAAEPWSAGRKQEWILAQLRRAVRYAAQESPYYRRVFERVGFDPHAPFDFDAFGRLPVLERSDVHAAGAEMIATAVAREQLRRDSTGGSTGTPTEVWLGPDERGWRESGSEYFMARVGLAAGTSIAQLWGHHLDPHGADDWRSRYHAFESNVRWLDCFRLSADAFDRYHAELSRWRPAGILAYATALGHFSEHLLERGLRPDYPRQTLVTGAEKLLPAHREAIEQAFGRPVHERYGSRDVGGMAFQVDPAASRDFHVDWSNVLLEPDADGTEAGILVTKLHADGMPMLRYRVGDVARFPQGSRPGWPALVLHEVLGRQSERIWLPDGRWLHGIQFPHMLKDHPVREFAFIQDSDYTVELQIVPKPAFDEQARQAILSTISANMPGIVPRLVLVDAIERTKSNKWRPVVSAVRPVTSA